MTQHDNIGCTTYGHENFYHHRSLHSDNYDFISHTGCAMCSCSRLGGRPARNGNSDAYAVAGVVATRDASRPYNGADDGNAFRGMMAVARNRGVPGGRWALVSRQAAAFSPAFVAAHIDRYSWAVATHPLNPADRTKRQDIEARNLEFWCRKEHEHNDVRSGGVA